MRVDLPKFQTFKLSNFQNVDPPPGSPKLSNFQTFKLSPGIFWPSGRFVRRPSSWRARRVVDAPPSAGTCPGKNFTNHVGFYTGPAFPLSGLFVFFFFFSGVLGGPVRRHTSPEKPHQTRWICFRLGHVPSLKV